MAWHGYGSDAEMLAVKMELMLSVSNASQSSVHSACMQGLHLNMQHY
jgi:hypothetical protein